MSTQTAVPTPAALPKPPSLKEIQAMLPGLKLYNPSNEWLPLNVHGRTDLWLPPDLKGAVEPHKVTGQPTKCDGVWEVKGRFLTQRDSSGKTIEGQDAHAVVSYCIKRERYGQMGVVWLPGRDAEEDRRYREAGRQIFLNYQAEKDERIIDKRREFKANWEKNPMQKGKPCPPPTPAENAAMERMQEREHRATYRYECDVPECPGYAQNDWDAFRRHMQAAHGVEPDRSRYDGEMTATGGETTEVPDAEVERDAGRGLSEAAAELQKRRRRKGRRKAT